MIGLLRGRLLSRQAPWLLIDVGGVGYEVQAPMSTFYRLPEVDAEVTLHTHLVVREDAHTLYGFGTLQERRLFRDLIKVNGVGARMALTILSGISAEDFARCVHDKDTLTLTRLPGVGKKTAERLVVKMRDKLAREEWPDAADDMEAGAGGSPVSDAVSALIALGYKPQEASRMVRNVKTTGQASEDIIRQALQNAVN